MSKVLAFAVAWLVAAAVALVVAWQGVSIVTDQVTDQRPAPLTAAQIEVPPTTTAAPAQPTTTAPARPTTTTSVAAAAAAPAAARAAVVPAPTTTTTVPAPAASSTTRTYTLVGGSASLKFSPSGVTVNWATPKPGFDVKVEPENGNGVRVEFESEAHRSRVDGWWDGGPQDRVREEDR